MVPDVFISHSVKDKESADEICQRLELEGYRCWIAPRDIDIGEDWAAAIVKAISRCRLMVVLVTEDANASVEVYREVVQASKKNLVVIPILLHKIELADHMKFYLDAVHWLDATQSPWDECSELLLRRVRGSIGERVAQVPVLRAMDAVLEEVPRESAHEEPSEEEIELLREQGPELGQETIIRDERTSELWERRRELLAVLDAVGQKKSRSEAARLEQAAHRKSAKLQPSRGVATSHAKIAPATVARKDVRRPEASVYTPLYSSGLALLFLPAFALVRTGLFVFDLANDGDVSSAWSKLKFWKIEPTVDNASRFAIAFLVCHLLFRFAISMEVEQKDARERFRPFYVVLLASLGLFLVASQLTQALLGPPMDGYLFWGLVFFFHAVGKRLFLAKRLS